MNQSTQQTASLEDNNLAFLSAWKTGVLISGPSLFGCQANAPDSAVTWRQLTPKLDVMRKAIPNKSQTDAAFIGILASFYNAEEGQKMLNKAGCSAFGHALSVLDKKRIDVIAALMINFGGW